MIKKVKRTSATRQESEPLADIAVFSNAAYCRTTQPNVVVIGIAARGRLANSTARQAATAA